jgi:hypothetical protein
MWSSCFIGSRTYPLSYFILNIWFWFFWISAKMPQVNFGLRRKTWGSAVIHVRWPNPKTSTGKRTSIDFKWQHPCQGQWISSRLFHMFAGEKSKIKDVRHSFFVFSRFLKRQLDSNTMEHFGEFEWVFPADFVCLSQGSVSRLQLVLLTHSSRKGK